MIREIRRKIFWSPVDTWNDNNDNSIRLYKEWIKENCKGYYIIKDKNTHNDKTPELLGCIFYIEDDDEAMAFKLRWL